MSSPRILVVAPRFPLPARSGTQLRLYHSLRALADDYAVTLVALVQDGEGTDRIEDVADLGVEVRPVPHSRSRREAALRFATSLAPYRTEKFATSALRTAVAEAVAGRSFDLAWVHFLTTLPVLPADFDGPVVLDQHNADVRYWESFADGPPWERLFAAANRAKLRRFRARYAEHVDAILSVSAADAAATREWADCPVWVVPNGVDAGAFAPSRSAEDADETVLFVGSLDVRMNVEALTWFVEVAWPEIGASRPAATFRIVGRDPTPAVRELGKAAGVEVVGEVLDVVPYYDDAAVVVAPFRLGGGTKLKVLEALAMERALVTTPVGATGLELTDDRHALVRERGPAFVAAVEDALSSPRLRARLGAAGRSAVVDRYDWDAVMDRATERVESTLLQGGNE